MATLWPSPESTMVPVHIPQHRTYARNCPIAVGAGRKSCGPVTRDLPALAADLPHVVSRERRTDPGSGLSPGVCSRGWGEPAFGPRQVQPLRRVVRPPGPGPAGPPRSTATAGAKYQPLTAAAPGHIAIDSVNSMPVRPGHPSAPRASRLLGVLGAGRVAGAGRIPGTAPRSGHRCPAARRAGIPRTPRGPAGACRSANASASRSATDSTGSRCSRRRARAELHDLLLAGPGPR